MIDIETRPARAYVGQRRRVKPAMFGAALAEILPATWKLLSERGVAPASPPVMLYLAHDVAAGEMEILGGFFVDASVAVEAPFESGEVPAGDVASTTHVGPYDGLGKAHCAMHGAIAAAGRAPGAVCWDEYVTDPGAEPDPAKWQTVVRYLLS